MKCSIHKYRCPLYHYLTIYCVFAGFSKEKKDSSSSHKAFFESRATCIKYQAAFRRNADPKSILVNEDFARAICALPDGDLEVNKKAYLDFFEHAGTVRITCGFNEIFSYSDIDI